MTWDKTLPASNSKISSAPGQITANWTAIEDGTVPYQKLHLDNLGGDPTPASGFGDVYGNLDGSYIELFYENDNADIIQLTSEGKIGTTSQAYLFDTLSHDGTTTYNEDNFITLWGQVSSAGALVNGTGFTPSRTAAGNYKITFSTAFSDTNYSVVATAFQNPKPNRFRICMVVEQTSTYCVINTQRNDQTGGSLEDCGFNFMIAGGR